MDEPKLSVEDQGGGSPALVFLHYFAGSSRSWRHVVDQAANAGRCVRLDVPGFGGSPPLTAYSVQGVAQAIGAAIAPMRLQSYLLLGHSMGGKLALAMALARPPGLAGLVLVAPSPPSPEPMDERERTLQTITRRPLPADDVAACIADNLRTSPEGWRWWLEGGSREDITAEVKEIAYPVLVLGGSDDPVIPPRVIAAQVMSVLPNAQRQEIPGAGHLLPLEAAQEVGLAIGAFAASLRDGGGHRRSL